MSGELRSQADWAPPDVTPRKGRRRQKKTPPVTRREVLAAGLKRIAITLVILVGLIAGAAVLLIHFSGMEASRAFPLAFFLGGAFLTLGGFLGATTGPAFDRMPGAGYGYDARAHGLSNSVVYGGFGIALIIVGAVLDAYL